MPDLNRNIAGLRCRDLLTVLTDYVDGDLIAAEVSRVNAHLDGCEHCRKFGGEYGSLVTALKDHHRPPHVTADVRARLEARLRLEWEGTSA